MSMPEMYWPLCSWDLILLLMLHLNSVPLPLYSRRKLPWPHGRWHSKGCESVYGVCTAGQEWWVSCHIHWRDGNIFLYIYWAGAGWLKKKMHVGFVSCSVFLAVLLCIGSSLQTDRREHYKQTCQLSTTSVLIRRHCLQEMLVLKLSSWKISKLSAFCLWRSPWRKWCLWPMCLLLLTRTCLELCLVFFDGGEEVGCGVDWPLGREGGASFDVSLPLVFGKKIALPKSYSGAKSQCLPTHWCRILIFDVGE